MDKIWNIAEVVIAFCGCCVGYYFGEINGIFIALIIFAVIDFVTGICSAIINKELCSKISFKGIAKKLFMFLIVGMANVLDVYVLNSSHALRTAAIFFYLANEGISIIENIAKSGLPIPQKLQSILLELRKKGDEDGTAGQGQ